MVNGPKNSFKNFKQIDPVNLENVKLGKAEIIASDFSRAVPAPFRVGRLFEFINNLVLFSAGEQKAVVQDRLTFLMLYSFF